MAFTPNVNLEKPAHGAASWDASWNTNADKIDALYDPATGHTHSGSGDNGPKLTQAHSHESPDTDVGPTSLHHTLGTGANQAAAGNDSRLSNSRTPTAHATSHESGGSDAIRLDQLAVPTADVSLNGHKLTSVTDPAAAQDAATKAYVDAIAQGLVWKASVRAATTANGTLATAFANGQTLDGVTLVTGDRILLKNQTSGAENGIYVVPASGAPTRATDADTAAEVRQAAVFVEEGTTHADSLWVNGTNAPITLGSTALVFVQLSGGGGSYSAGTGLGLSGSIFSVDIPSLTADATPNGAADYVMTYDASAATNKKVLLNNLPGGGGMSNPMTTAGDIIIGDTGGTPLRLPKGSSGQVLTIDPSTVLPVWATVKAYGAPFDVPPASPSSYDDEFTAGTLDGKWTDPAITSRTNTIVLASDWLYLEPSESGGASTGKRANAIRQNSPAGSFTITAKFADNAPSNDDGRLGLFTGRTASNKGIIWGPYRANGSQAAFCTFAYAETTDFGAYDSDANSTYGTYSGACHYRMIWDAGASTMVYQYSVDGVFWTTALTRSSQAQPDRMGIALWSNSGTLLADHVLACDYFRVT